MHAGATATNMFAHALGNWTGAHRDLVLLGGRFRMQRGSHVRVQAGCLLEGTGNIQGFVDSAGLVAPGRDRIAALAAGTFSQSAAASIGADLKGATAGSDRDQLAVT